MQIQNTENYGVFKTHSNQPRNRTKPSPQFLESLKATKGNKYAPIIVYNENENKVILDGHRRLQALRALELPVFFIEVEDKIEVDKLIIMFNTTSTAWTMMNYINSHSQTKPEYEKLLEFIKRKSSSIELAKIFGRVTADMLKGGVKLKLNYRELERVRHTVSYICGLLMVNKTQVIRALGKEYNKASNYDLDALIEKFEQKRLNGEYDTVTFQSTVDKIQGMIQEAYSSKIEQVA